MMFDIVYDKVSTKSFLKVFEFLMLYTVLYTDKPDEYTDIL